MLAKHKISLISALHYFKLFYRSVLFILALVMYVVSRIQNSGELFQGYEREYWLLGIIWLVYAFEMVSRFFPARLESMGSEKQFRRNFRPTGKTEPMLQSWKQTFAIAAAWLILNSFIGILYYTGVIDEGILVLISLAYGVCDMVCILFSCPFQTWFMKNRCCTVCRIYNWDFAMMFTPFIFIPNGYTWSLLAMSLLLLARWEITVHRYPERFSDRTNANLTCANCKEKLCHHKKQLQGFWKKNRIFKNLQLEKKKRDRI